MPSRIASTISRHDDHPCAVCGASTSAREMTAPGGPRCLCRDHMPTEAVEVLDEIEELRRKAEPTRQ